MDNQTDSKIFTPIEGNSIRRNLSGFIDATIILILITFLSILIPNNRSISLNLFSCIIVLGIYRLIFLSTFKATIGMMTCGIQLLNEKLEPISNKEKTLASFFILFNGVNYYKK